MCTVDNSVYIISELFSWEQILIQNTKIYLDRDLINVFAPSQLKCEFFTLCKLGMDYWHAGQEYLYDL